jgi:hypothetical protein
MDVLPNDNLLKIASFLDTKSIMNFGLTCKNTKELIWLSRCIVDDNAYQQVEQMIKKCCSTLDDVLVASKCFINLSWTVEDDGDELEVSINIGGNAIKNNMLVATIQNHVDIIPPMEVFNVDDISGIVSFVQNNSYVQFFEDAKCQWCLLRHNGVNRF